MEGKASKAFDNLRSELRDIYIFANFMLSVIVGSYFKDLVVCFDKSNYNGVAYAVYTLDKLKIGSLRFLIGFFLFIPIGAAWKSHFYTLNRFRGESIYSGTPVEEVFNFDLKLIFIVTVLYVLVIVFIMMFELYFHVLPAFLLMGMVYTMMFCQKYSYIRKYLALNSNGGQI